MSTAKKTARTAATKAATKKAAAKKAATKKEAEKTAPKRIAQVVAAKPRAAKLPAAETSAAKRTAGASAAKRTAGAPAGGTRPARARGPRTVLVGDVGGTRTRLALYAQGSHTPLAEHVYPSGAHAGLEEIVETFLASASSEHPEAAVFGVAGPVRHGAAAITNLPWTMDERELSARLRVRRVVLANDLVVGARGCIEVPLEELTLLTATPPAHIGEHLGVIAAGTGLGESRLLWIDGRYRALPTEGGHCDFAARSAIELDLYRFLAERFPGHVSNERVISGAGLGCLYDFFVSREGPDPADIAAQLAAGDRNAVICQLGLAGAHRPAVLAVDLFARIYGAEAGNIALRELSLGGVYVIGNIGSTILPAKRDLFLEGFLDKGRFREMLAAVPVAVVRDPLVGLRGARAMAEELAND